MIKLFSLKKEQQEAKASGGKKTTPGLLRVQSDMAEISVPPHMKMEFPDGAENMMHFKLLIKPDSGFYKGGTFKFDVNVPEMYPHDAPKVKCEQTVYHPNIDYDGNVCLNILREDWKPILNLNAVLFGMGMLFDEPGASDPLNKEAGELLGKDKNAFAMNVVRSMKGGTVNGRNFDRVI